MRRALSSGLGILLAAAAGSAAAHPAPALTLGTGSHFGPGQLVEVRWSLPGRAEELELLLSLDGGESFPVRLTRDLDPRTRSALWRVPALPTERAVLALRVGRGDEGAERREEIVVTSGAFTIESEGAARSEDLRFSKGEWRTAEAREGGGDLPAAGLSGGSQERMSSVERDLAAEDGSRTFSLERQDSRLPPRPSVPLASQAPTPAAASRPPVNLPKRE